MSRRGSSERDRRAVVVLATVAGVLAVAMGAVAFGALGHLDHAIDDLQARGEARVDLLRAGDAEAELLADLVALREAVADGDAAATTDLAEEAAVHGVELQRHIDELAEADLPTGASALLREAQASLSFFLGSAEDVVSSLHTPWAMRSALEEAVAFHAEADDDVHGALEAIDSAVAAAQAHADADRQRVAWSIAGAALVAAAVMTFALAKVLGRQRSRLGAITAAVTALRHGDYTARAAEQRGELGQVADAFNGLADEVVGLIHRLETEAARDAFGTQLGEALEVADTESAAHIVVSRAMGHVSTAYSMELLVADSSNANLERAAEHPRNGAPGCGVESPWSCMAVRRGAPVSFSSGDDLNACSFLWNRPGGSACAMCVPVNFMGRALGVLHAAGPAYCLPSDEEARRLVTLGAQAGARIGTVRAFERTQIQASTDALTGLHNRRWLEERLNSLLVSKAHFALAMADLDHFKRLNDSFGHETGDRALRVFAQVCRDSLRGDDMVARWGGEEFALVFPGIGAPDAAAALDRLREDLLLATIGGEAPRFTASFGVADTTMGDRLDALVRVADDALYRAKEAGRDQVVVGDPATGGSVVRRAPDQDAVVDNQAAVDAL